MKILNQLLRNTPKSEQSIPTATEATAILMERFGIPETIAEKLGVALLPTALKEVTTQMRGARASFSLKDGVHSAVVSTNVRNGVSKARDAFRTTRPSTEDCRESDKLLCVEAGALLTKMLSAALVEDRKMGYQEVRASLDYLHPFDDFASLTVHLQWRPTTT